jgi:hypothetical protein
LLLAGGVAIAVLAVSWVKVGGALALNTPTIAATASGSGPLGGEVHDEARLEGSSEATGTIEFSLYNPGDTICSGQPEGAEAETVSGPGPYVAEGFPENVGDYNYVVRYGGDAQNAPASTTCGQASQQLDMTPGRPSLVTTASIVSGFIEDNALLSGGVPTSGTIVFRLFGPEDAACGGAPAFVSSLPVGYQGHYSSGPFTPSLPGVYRFEADYSGDANDEPATAACGGLGETVSVTGIQHPSLTQRTAGNAIVGEQISDTVTVAGGLVPTGTVTFRLFAPTDTSCARGALAVSSVAVAGDGTYSSDPYTTSVPGDYRYTVSYSGDGANASATTPCGEGGGTVTVAPPPPTLARSFTVAPVSGTVRVQAAASSARVSGSARAASAGFVELRSPRTLPIGSTVDTLRGTARVTTATHSVGRTQSGVFRGSAFVVDQNRLGLTRLHPIDRKGIVCAGSTRATAAARRHLSKQLLARLHSESSGNFVIDARDSAASERGTVWEVRDQCDGTLTRVFQGVVVVLEYHSGRNITLRAGMRYLARAR